MLQGEITVTGQFSGVVMYYDLPPERMEALRRLAADGRSYLMLCSVILPIRCGRQPPCRTM